MDGQNIATEQSFVNFSQNWTFQKLKWSRVHVWNGIQTGMKTYVPHKNLYPNVHRSIIHSSQKVEATQMSLRWWMDRQVMIYPYMEHYLAIKRNIVSIHATTWTLKIFCWMNEASYKRPHILHEMSRLGNPYKQEVG